MSRGPPYGGAANRLRNAPPSSYSQDSRPDSIVSDGTGTGIPTRPSRSELRRVPSQSTDRGYFDNSRGSTDSRGMPPARPPRAANRDSTSTSFSDREVQPRRPLNAGSTRDREYGGRSSDRDPYGRERGLLSEPETPNRGLNGSSLRSPISPESAASPSFQAAITALQSAGQQRARRKGTLEGQMAPDGGFMSPQGVSPGGFGDYEELQREERERRRREQAKADAERRERMKEREAASRRGGQSNGKVRRGDIDAILDQIQGEWEWVTKPEFNPVELALALLDEGSSGKDMESFIRTKRMLARALKGSIETYAQTFAAALPHHAAIMTSLNESQEHIKNSKSKLIEAKESLGSRRADLAQLWTRGQTLDEMIKIVDEIEYLKSVPDNLESLISEKKLLQASSLLIRSIKMITKSDMQDIGALSDLKAYLTGQETTLRDILIDELQAHMYLKVFWCDTRWAAYQAGQQALPRVEFDEEKLPMPTSFNPNSRSTRLATFLHELNLKANDSPYDPSQSSRISIALPGPLTDNNQNNPESDSFTYLETILESLAILGKLGDALETITQRLPMELYALVEATTDEVNERTEFSRRMLPNFGNKENVVAVKTSTTYVLIDPKTVTKGPQGSTNDGAVPGEQSPASLLRYNELENSASNADHEVLRDLFWTLYSKMDAVGQSMRVVYEVANRIGARKDFKDSSGAKPGTLFPFPELWEPIEAELRGLIMLYLMVEKGGASTGKASIPSISDALQSSKAARNRGWQSFRFGDSDSKLAIRANKGHEEELTRVLKDSVPGLVGAETLAQTALVTAVDDRFASAVPHQVLVSPNAFHISVVFHPTLAFFERAAEVLPSTTSERVRQSSAFLEEFVQRSYLPQLEEKVAGLFIKTVTSPDAFLPDPAWKRLSSRPLVRAATELMALINSLCAMQQTTPFHRDNYSRLILGVVIQFYQRCSDRFRELVSTKEGTSQDDAHVAVAARWAQKLEVAACVSALYALPENDVANSRRLCRQETRVELNFLTTETVNRDDLVNSKNLHALGNLFHSLIWFMRQLVSMRVIVEDPLSPAPDSAVEPESSIATAITPHFPILPPAPPSEELRLPLTKPMALRFDALMRTYEQLAEYVLATLRIDTRCRTIHFLDLAMRRGNYRVDRDAGDPDPHIVDLNLDLGVCDDCANETLPPKERRFLFEGLGTLMEHLLISNARHIRFANAVGIQKIMRNMLAMQQNMKTITDASQDADFERAKVYYSLFSLTPKEMLASIKKRSQFTLDEYKSMLNFQCGVDQAAGEKGALNASDRNYHSYVTELHALAIEESTD
ncbi:Probable exocyst complex component sec8 [Serendipita indica DSM 11827]|nr:Probable exocyst complex component sec8 [Serendipita indica DSM 11827]